MSDLCSEWTRRKTQTALLVRSLFPVMPVAFLLLLGAMRAPNEQRTADHANAKTIGDQTDSSPYKITEVYDGEYFCLQGRTRFSLQVLSGSAYPSRRAIFSFGGLSQNSGIPDGAFLVQGRIDLQGGILDLSPLSWLKRPENYVMVGLQGRSDDGGDTFTGTITGGYQCTAFFLQLSH